MINRMQGDGVIGKYAIGGAVGATFYLEPSATVDVDIFAMLPKAGSSSLLSRAPIYEYLKAHGCDADGEHVVIGEWPVQFMAPSDALERDALGGHGDRNRRRQDLGDDSGALSCHSHSHRTPKGSCEDLAVPGTGCCRHGEA